jgi:uncharacterized membrane protein HdeD (DUF308 family)
MSMDFKQHPDTDFKAVGKLEPTEAAEEIRSLYEGIHHHDRLYYVKNRPEISDALYDRLFRRLQMLEQRFPDLRAPDSPTRRVGAAPIGKLKKVRHQAPLLSLQATPQRGDIEAFLQTVRSTGRDTDLRYSLEPEFDGLSVELVYETGGCDVNETTDRMMNDYLTSITPEVRLNHRWFLILGIALFVLGIAAIVFPFFATLTVELLIGWVLTLSGGIQLVHGFRNTKWRGFIFSLFGALLSLGVGIMLLIYPLTGVLSLTLLIAVFLIADGLFRILLALRLRPFDHWAWLLLSGVLGLGLALIILSQWPQAAAWIIGLLVGIDLVFAGWTTMMLATAARRSA